MYNFNDPLLNLHEITLTLLSENDPDILLNTILDQAIEFTKADSGSIALLDDTRKFLVIKVFRGLAKDVPEKVKLKLGEGVTGRCILTGKIRNVGNTKEDPYYVSVRSDIQSELAIPLKAGQKSFGVISVDSSRLAAFSREHEEYLNLLANYTAQIYTHQETIRHLNDRQFIQDLVIQISTFLGREPDFKKVFENTVKLLEEKIGLNRAALFLLNDVSNDLTIEYSLNYSENQIERSRYKPGEGLTGKVFSTKIPMVLADISEDKNFLNKSGISRIDSRISFFSSPIILKDKVKGVFNMEIPYVNQGKFSDYAFLVQLLSTFFSQAILIQDLIEQTTSDIKNENILLKRQFDQRFVFENIAGKSNVMQQLFKTLAMAADSNSSILLTGESGTGKELFASAIHRNSLRKDNKLVKINCAAIPSDLLESELFGYEKGAFTGADKDYPGKFLVAHKGTLFLDEIGDMDYKLQSKLLRFLQEKEFSPLGSNKVYNVDVRIIAATNVDIETMITENKFREDLFYRLNVIRIQIPPLRERIEDLPFIVEHLLNKIATNNNKQIKSVTREVYKALESYPFPGNVRELENILERGFVLSKGNTIDIIDIDLPGGTSKELYTQSGSTEKNKKLNINESENTITDWIQNVILSSNEGNYYKDVINELEKELIQLFLKKTFYNKSKTARVLGLNRLTLDKKIKDIPII
ncbi:MAG: sigma 54-interacting transcriptional regulator [Spirochaetia bacterium]|nr:sigma 54-interacting transcriptional regulator [Spirochaetia bacterium]